jgi:hypothetical protein
MALPFLFQAYSDLPAIFDNYHLPRKNARFDLLILPEHLWRGRFQMPVKGERQVTGGNGRNPSGQEVLIWSG